MPNHPVAFFEIVSADAPRAQAFYRDLFGWTIETDDQGYGLVDTGAGDDAIGGGVGPSMAAGDTGVKVYVRTTDLEGTIARPGARLVGLPRTDGPPRRLRPDRGRQRPGRTPAGPLVLTHPRPAPVDPRAPDATRQGLTVQF
jgi:catechol 2,3-dioxygenase-like lactoylglutathione lyase family enzyme